MHCSYCGSHLHDKRTCPHSWDGSVTRARLRCTYCGGRDHDEQACPKRHTGRAYQAKGIIIRDTWRR